MYTTFNMMSKRAPSLYSLASFLLAMLVLTNTQQIVHTLRIVIAKRLQDRVKRCSLDRRQWHRNPQGTLSMSSATPFISSSNSSSSSFGMELNSNTDANDKISQQQIVRIPMSEEDMREMMAGERTNTEGSGDKNIWLLQNRPKDAENNKYFRMIEKLAPNEMLAKFAQSAPQNVQEAAKSTIMNILGSLPTYALDASLFTTNTKLANLMFQMQITGYMFKNAEYRMSFTRSLKGYPKLPPTAKVSDGNTTMTLSAPPSSAASTLSIASSIPSGGSEVSVEGTITVRGPNGESIQVPAKDVTDALLKEVEDLRNELVLVRQAKEAELRGNM